MTKEESELSEAEKLGRMQQEIHTLTNSTSKLFELVDKLNDNIQSLTIAMRPKPADKATVISAIAGLFVIVAGMLGVVIWINQTSNAPIQANMQQMAKIIQVINDNANKNTNLIQLTNKELSGIKEKTEGNAETLQWLLFDENIPKQVTNHEKDIEYMKRDLNYLITKAHKGE